MIFILKSPLEECLSIPYSEGTDPITAGNFYTAGPIHGFALTDAPRSDITLDNYTLANGATIAPPDVENISTLIVRAACVLAEKVSGAVTQGQKLYWDAAEAKVTTESTGNDAIGWAREAAASGDATVLMRFDGEQEV